MPLQTVVAPVTPVGATEAVFTVMLALDGEVSTVGILSTCVFIVAVPPVPFEVNKAVAVPDACMVACCPERVPNVVGPQVTILPIKVERFATPIASLAELERKLVVMVEVLVGVLAAVLQIIVGEAVVFSCNHLVSTSEPPPATSPPALSHGDAVGPLLQPHQLFSAFTLPADSTKCSAPEAAPALAMLPTNRLKFIAGMLRFGELFTEIAPPNPSAVLLINVFLVTVALKGVTPACPAIATAPPLEAGAPGKTTLLPEKVEFVIEQVPKPVPTPELKTMNKTAPPSASLLTLLVNVQLSILRSPRTCIQTAAPPNALAGSTLLSNTQLFIVRDSADPPPAQIAAPPYGSELRYPF